MTKSGHTLLSTTGELASVVQGLWVSLVAFSGAQFSEHAELRRRATQPPVHNLRRPPPRGGSVAVLDGPPVRFGLLREALVCVLLWARLF